MVWFIEFSRDKTKVSSLIKCQASQKKKMADMALNNPSSDSFQSTVILLQCSFLPHYSKTKRFLRPKGRMLLTKSELSFSLEVVSAVSGSVVMVLQITSLTFSWTSAPSTSLSWDINHRQQYSELTTWKIEVHDRGGSRIFFRRVCTRLLLYFNTHKPHSFLFLQNTSCAPPTPSP